MSGNHEQTTDRPSPSADEIAREMGILYEDEQRHEAIIAEQKRGVMRGFLALQRDVLVTMHAHGVETVTPSRSPLLRTRESA